MTASTALRAAARYEVSTCRNCFEPIVRLRVEGLREDVWVRWLHTPNRLNCLNAWREVTGTVAEPRQMFLLRLGLAA